MARTCDPALSGARNTEAGVSEDQSIAVESLSRPNNLRILEEVAGEILGGNWKLDFELREDLSVARVKPESPPGPIDAMEVFKNDPKIQKALELFRAEIQSEP